MFFLSNGLTFYLNPTYNHLTYDGDITYQGQTFSTDSKQVVDVPRWSATSGLIIKYKDFEINSSTEIYREKIRKCRT